MTRENWFITNVIREICQNSYVKGTMTPPPPYYPLQMKLHLRYFRVVLFLLQRFKKIWIFRFFLWSLTSSIIQCKSAKRNHVLHWVTTTQPSELNELKTNCIVRTISLQIQLLPLARHKLTNVLTLFQVLVRSLVRVSSSTNNDSAKNTTFPLNESHLWTLHTSYLLTYIYQIRISF